MDHNQQLSALVLRCQEYDPKAQKVVFERLSPTMLGVCLRYVPQSDQAEELMLNGFLTVFQKITQFRGEGSFEGWVRRIMINECLAYLRSQQWLFVYREEQAMAHLGYDADQLQGLAADDLMHMVQALPQGYRTVFNLYAIEGYSHKEIAEQLGISENTSKSQLSRARTLLQKMLANYETTNQQISHG
jgi:RNA polymerase sigma-70 factor (ECF subfamily)